LRGVGGGVDELRSLGQLRGAFGREWKERARADDGDAIRIRDQRALFAVLTEITRIAHGIGEFGDLRALDGKHR
jgi:hypothetical protein